MRARTLVPFAAVLLVALVLVQGALAGDARVSIRVEGKTQTLFGATGPLVTPFVGTVSGEDNTTHAPVDVALTGPNVLGALEAASLEGEFAYRLLVFSFGTYVDRVGRYAGIGANGWSFRVNGRASDVGADQTAVEHGDEVVWYWGAFDARLLELSLQRLNGKGCVVAWARSDNGKRARIGGVVFEVDGREVRSARGAYCGSWSSIRASKGGFVRSELELAG